MAGLEVGDMTALHAGGQTLPGGLVLSNGLEEAVGAVVVLGEGGGHSAPLLGEGGGHSAPRAGPVPCQVHSTVSAARLLGLDTRGYELNFYYIISE